MFSSNGEGGETVRVSETVVCACVLERTTECVRERDRER